MTVYRGDGGQALVERLRGQYPGSTKLEHEAADHIEAQAAEIERLKGDATQLADVAINETSELTTGLEVVHSEVWNIALPFIWLPTPEMRIVVEVGNVVVVNMNTTDTLTMSGTIYFEEVGG